MFRLAIVDLDSGNITSVYSTINSILQEGNKGDKCEIVIADNYSQIPDADMVVMPGVGSFDHVSRNLERRINMITALEEHTFARRRPFLGICVGMQILGEYGEENGRHEGLGWIKGSAKRLVAKITPHVGWNNIVPNPDSPRVLDYGSAMSLDLYFTHTYYMDVQVDEVSKVLTYTQYEGQDFCSSIAFDNVLACQFHPEKSGKAGKSFIWDFLSQYLQ